jgi:hypothetical protein
MNGNSLMGLQGRVTTTYNSKAQSLAGHFMRNRFGWEKASWIAGVIAAIVAVIALFGQTATGPQGGTTVTQTAGNGATQIGSVGGNVSIRNAPAVQGQPDIPKIYGMDYADARKELIESGWMPNAYHWTHGNEDGMELGNAVIFWNRGYHELNSCASTGVSQCRFEFIDARGDCLAVITEGEEHEEASMHAKVASAFLYKQGQ